VQLPELPPGWCQGGAPYAVGWAANGQGRLLPCLLNAAPMMDPTALAQQAVDLNLRLMRWRAAPELDIAALARLK
jgi:ubiquitin-like modifier-activating enzyme ATG7